MDKHIRIEEFLDGNLSDEQLEEFLKLKALDPSIGSEIDLRAEINEAIKDKDFIEFMQLVNGGNGKSSGFSKTRFQRELLKTWHIAAASFSLIIVVGGLWYLLSNRSYSTDKLVSKYYKPAHPLLQVRSAESGSDDALKEAFNFYQKNDFENALEYFTTLENQITAKFYAGVCYIELEKFDSAIESFVYVIDDNDNLFVEPAEWYLGLIYLMNNQKSKAVSQFKAISDSDSFYADQAVEILKYLN